MTRLPLFLLLGTILGASAQATVIYTSACTPTTLFFANGVGIQSFGCGGLDAGVGNTLQVSYQIGADYQFGSSLGSSVSLLFSPTGAGAVFGNHTIVVNGSFSSANCVVDGNSGIPCVEGTDVTVSTASLGETLSAFSVNVTSSVIQGTVVQSLADPVLVYTIVTPEPGAIQLLAGSLLLGGFLKRRKN